MSKTLPPEIIRPIILYLNDDKNSLYSCLLVSRDWCRETISLLWRQPFHFLYACSKTKSSKLTTPLINNCYCSISKRQSQAANLLITYLSIKYNDELVKGGIIKIKGGNVMFNYLEFLNALDLHELYSAIQDWIQWDTKNAKNCTKLNSNQLYHHMFEFFFTHSPKLKLLSFDTEFIIHKNNHNIPCLYLKKDFRIANNLLINESKTPEIKQGFASLTELIFTTELRKIQIFSFLSQLCHNIQKLIIRIKFETDIIYSCGLIRTMIISSTLEEASQLASLIRSQKNLVYFELFDTIVGGTNKIIKALEETQYNSLKTLILNDVSISDNNTILSHLKHLQNLQELRFNKCIYSKSYILSIPEKTKNCWKGLWLPNLKYLGVDFVEYGEYQGKSKELSSILLGCSPLVNKI